MRRAGLFALMALGSGIAFAKTEPNQEPSEQVAVALSEGSVTAASSRPNRKKLRAAAQLLARLGARPADGDQADLGVAWEAKAGPASKADPIYRGRILGPAYRSGLVKPGMPAETDQLFLGGQPARLSVAPSKGARLTLALVNGKGEAICTSAVQQPASTCRWVPAYAERVHIRIDNIGVAPASYFLVVN
jgi:hypothetical protein